MVAIRERWLADGWEFTEGDIRDVEYRSGQLGAPGTRGSNATVSNRTGEVWRPKLHGAGSFTLEVWFGTYQRQAQQLWDHILRAVVQPHRQVEWRRITAAGETRTCLGEVTAALQPTAIGQSGYRASIEVNVPRGYWRSEQEFTAATELAGAPAVGADGKPYRDLPLTAWADSTAPMEELTLRLDGQLVNPRVTDRSPLGRAGELFYAQTIPANQAMVLGSGDWSITGVGGLGPVEAAVNYTGDRFLTVAATPPGMTPTLRLSADTIGAAGQLTVSGPRAYLC